MATAFTLENPSYGNERRSDSDRTDYSTAASSFDCILRRFLPDHKQTRSSNINIGVDETLWNPDRTRYGGYLLPSKEYTTSGKEFERTFSEWLKKQNAPLTPEEEAQSERWLATSRACRTELDPALVDEAIEYLEGDFTEM